MKKFAVIMAMLAFCVSMNAKVVEKTFTVRGHCGMCKMRIENAAKGFEGVEAAEYDLKGQSLKLTYDKKSVSPKDVMKAIAALGYDAGKVKATDEAYNKLEECCRYREIKGINDHAHEGGHGMHHTE
ncbi:MAG: heavy-metal-associated domain-containing protein [Bacteroidales bacterium]|nr:heavy-metal-associated domain-containing protein [Bacteroidales bacterium]